MSILVNTGLVHWARCIPLRGTNIMRATCFQSKMTQTLKASKQKCSSIGLAISLIHARVYIYICTCARYFFKKYRRIIILGCAKYRFNTSLRFLVDSTKLRIVAIIPLKMSSFVVYIYYILISQSEKFVFSRVRDIKFKEFLNSS